MIENNEKTTTINELKQLKLKKKGKRKLKLTTNDGGNVYKLVSIAFGYFVKLHFDDQNLIQSRVLRNMIMITYGMSEKSQFL